MNCIIYRSLKQDYTYLYLAEGKELEDLPGQLLGQFGEPEVVMELDLGKRHRLAQADIDVVKHQLAERGYYLQLPPEHDIDELLDQKFNQ